MELPDLSQSETVEGQPFRAWAVERSVFSSAEEKARDPLLGTQLVSYMQDLRATPPQVLNFLETEGRAAMRIASRGCIRRDVCYKPIGSSSHISTFTLQPQGIVQADVLQRSYAAYGLRTPGAGGGPPTPASRVAQAQAWARRINALGFNYAREISLSYNWTILLSNAFSLLVGYELRAVARTLWRRRLAQVTCSRGRFRILKQVLLASLRGRLST